MTEISVNLPVVSTAFLPDACRLWTGHPTGMELKTISDNIDRLLRLRGMNADEASRASGHPDAIRNIRRKLKGGIKGQGVSAKIVNSLAKVFKVSVNELMEPYDKPPVPAVPGLRGHLLSQLQYLDNERARVLEQLELLDQAEITAKKPQKRKIR